MADVAGQAGAVGVVGFELLHVKEAAFGQSGIHRRARVTFTEDEPVALRPIRFLRANIQHACIQCGHDLRQRKHRCRYGSRG